MSTRPTVLNTKKEYGMIIFVPTKKKEMTRTTSRQDIALRGITMIYISRRYKQVSLPDDFAKMS